MNYYDLIWDKKLPSIPDLKISSKWNNLPSYSWMLETLLDYYLGISNLEGVGWLFDNWLKIEKELITNGRVAVVFYGKQFLIAAIVELKRNYNNKITKFIIRFLGDNRDREVFPNPEDQVLKKGEEPRKKKPRDVDLDKTVIFINNQFETGDFKGLSNETQKMDLYLELIRHSLEYTKDTLIVKTKGKLGAKAEGNIIEGLAKGKLLNIYYQDKETKQQVDPNSYSHELTGGAWEQRQFYWKEYNMIKEGIFEKYKIRHIDAAEKFFRTNESENYSNLSIYWAWEQQRGHVRMVAIREFMEKFPKAGKYNLNYGFIFGSQPESHEKKEKITLSNEKKDDQKDQGEQKN